MKGFDSAELGDPMNPMRDQLAHWTGPEGNAYTERNALDPNQLMARIKLWSRILSYIGTPSTVLEVGANVGQNLHAIRSICIRSNSYPRLMASEPNDAARAKLSGALLCDPADVCECAAESLEFHDGVADLVFTSGVLIHISPGNLLTACRQIHRVSRRYIVAVEYFSKRPTMVPYRGETDRLWTRDFGAFYLDNFPDLKPVACGFAWERLTGLDDLTWWVLQKQ